MGGALIRIRCCYFLNNAAARISHPPSLPPSTLEQPIQIPTGNQPISAVVLGFFVYSCRACSTAPPSLQLSAAVVAEIIVGIYVISKCLLARCAALNAENIMIIIILKLFSQMENFGKNVDICFVFFFFVFLKQTQLEPSVCAINTDQLDYFSFIFTFGHC